MPFFGPLIEIANKLASPWKELLWGAIVLGTTGFLLIKTFRYVPQGQRAMLTRNRKVVFRNGRPVYKEAGLYVVFPIVNNLECVSILDRTFDLRTVTARQGYCASEVTATVVFAAVDIYSIRYVVDDFVNRLTSACEEILSDLVLAIHPDEIKTSKREIVAAFRLAAVPVSQELGVRFKDLNITQIAPRDQIVIAGAIASLGPEKRAVLKETLGAPLTGNHE